DVQKFSSMLRNVYLPEVGNFTKVNGNWDTSMIEATMNIAIFTDDMPLFQKAVTRWHQRTPAYIYMSSARPPPVQPPGDPRPQPSLRGYWYTPAKFVDGLTQESCRDLPNKGTQGFGHAQYGVAAIINAAETAQIQGVDLFAAERKRLVAMLELHSKYMNG